MAEPNVEMLTADQYQEREQEWRAFYQPKTPITEGILQAIRAHIAAGQRPPRPPEAEREGRVSAETEDRLRTGKGIVDFLPEEYKEQPDVPLNRKYTKIEKEILEITEHADLKGDKYHKPPGEVVQIDKATKRHIINWAEYGWAAEAKRSVEDLLTTKFDLHGRQRELAMEVLLAKGYTANEVNARLNTPGVPDNIPRERRWEYFKEIFSEPDDPMPESSLNVVFNEDRHEDGRVFQPKNPDSMEELAWQMSWTGDAGGNEKWMVGGAHALLELRMKTKEEHDRDMAKGDKSWGKYYVNENNVLEWYRNELDLLWDIHGPNTPIQVQDFIKMRKGGFYQISFRDIIEQKGQIFNSEDKKTSYEQTWLQLQWEANTFQTLYDNDIIYRQASGVGMDEWIKQYEQMTLMNPLTKLGFRTNMLQRLLTGTQDYQEGRIEFDQGKYLSDNVLGGAFVEMVLAFYNLGDFDKLQEVLGTDSSFFTREGWLQAITDVAKATAKRSGGQVVMAPETAKLFEDAFKHENTLSASSDSKAKAAFMEFINFCTTNLPGAYQELFINFAVMNSVKKRFNVGDRAGLSLTAAEAWFFNRFMGGLARNDVGTAKKVDSKGHEFVYPSPSVHDKMSEIINMNSNRLKYASGEGKPYGNLETLGKHLAAAVLPMLGIVSQQETAALDEHGNEIMKDGKPVMMRKSVLRIFEDLHNLRVQQQERVKLMEGQLSSINDPHQHRVLKQELLEQDKKQNRKYMEIVGRDAAFRENAHREYTQVHLKPGYKWMHRIMKGEGIDLNDFNIYDAFGGVTFNKEKFISKIQGDLIGTVRDMVRKYKWMNMNEDIRMPFIHPVTGKSVFKDAKLAQLLFGYDVLNCEAFWKKDKYGHVIKRHGLPEIDFNKVEANRHQLMKQVFMTELAADLYGHQVRNSGDPRFKHHYYLNVIESLNTISGKVIVEELKKHGVEVDEDFLSKKDIAWLKARALNGKVLFWDMGTFGFHLKWWLTALWAKDDKDGKGIGKMFSIIMSKVFTLN